MLYDLVDTLSLLFHAGFDPADIYLDADPAQFGVDAQEKPLIAGDSPTILGIERRPF